MAVWQINSIQDRPDVTLRDWAAFKVWPGPALQPAEHVCRRSGRHRRGEGQAVSAPIDQRAR
jgi:hypothetical protein